MNQEKKLSGMKKGSKDNVKAICKILDLEYKAVYTLICEHAIDINKIRSLFPLRHFFLKIQEM